MKRAKSSSKSVWHPPLQPEDAALWEDVKKTVKRIAKEKAENELRIAAQKSPAPSLKSAPAGLEQKIAAKPQAPPASAFDRVSLRKIKTGKLPVEDVLDLHGLRLDAAHHALEAFILTCAARGLKLVLVITGKGDRFVKSEGGVLRQSVPRWLKESGLARAVSGFTKAAQAHGGEGAFYVRLKKRPKL